MMFSLSLLFLLIILSAVESASDEAGKSLAERRYNGLKFGATAQDYVRFQPRMEPLQESFSLCGWVNKRRGVNQLTYWFDYYYGNSSSGLDIHVTDSGHYTFGYNRDRRSKVTDQVGKWRHICVTWSLASRIARLYFDGVFLGSTTTYPPGRKIGLDGYVVLGNRFSTGGFKDSYAFGGDLFKANVFAKELDASEVKEMADGGLCSEVEEKYGRSRYLKWEDFLLEEKSGNVMEIDVGCTPEPIKEDGEEETNTSEDYTPEPMKEDAEEETNISEDYECDEQGNGTTFSAWDHLLHYILFVSCIVSSSKILY